MLFKILKFITFPIWFPFKVLWFVSKVIVILLLAAAVFFLLYGYGFLK